MGTPTGTQVVVVGSLNLDLVVSAPRLPGPGETLLGVGFAEQIGGKGCNQAIAARRAGAPVAMVGRVGADEAGARVRSLLAAEGVDTEWVGDDPAGTGIALIEVASSGENTIVVVPRANAALQPAHVAAAAPLLAAARVLVLQGEVAPATSLCAAEHVAAAGGLVVFNAAPAPRPGPECSRLLALCDWVVVNESEATALGGPGTEGPQALRRRSGGSLLLTLGARGCLWLPPDGASWAFPSPEVEARDTVGAGDAFVGALAAALAGGAPPERAIASASAAGALACTRSGAAAAMPHLGDILRLASRLVAKPAAPLGPTASP